MQWKFQQWRKSFLSRFGLLESQGFVEPTFPPLGTFAVATLALASRPRQRGCKVAGKKEPGSQGKEAAKVRAKKKPKTKKKPGNHITYSRECKKCKGVWGNEPSHSQGNSHFGRWSPSGLSKLQRAIAGVKTQWLVTFFISLESSWNVHV